MLCSVFQLEQELDEGEGDWVKKEMELMKAEEEDRHKEMMEYERFMAEEQKARIVSMIGVQ